MSKIILNNILTYGDFENAGWSAASKCILSYVTNPVKYGSYALKVQSTSSFKTELYFVQNTTVPQISGHIYYVRCEMYQQSAVSSGMQSYWPQAEPTMGTAIYDTSKLNTWQIQSFRTNRSNWGTGNQQFRFDVENIQSPNYVFIDGAMIIDLTSDFGSGNEPTKEWCDKNIPFFLGTLELKNVEMKAKISGSVRNIKTTYIKQNEIWKEIKIAYSKINGNWLTN